MTAILQTTVVAVTDSQVTVRVDGSQSRRCFTGTWVSRPAARGTWVSRRD